MSYGVCPKCGGEVSLRERGLNGDDVCENGHKYPSRETLTQHAYHRVNRLESSIERLTVAAKALLAKFDVPGGAFIGGGAWEVEQLRRALPQEGNQDAQA